MLQLASVGSNLCKLGKDTPGGTVFVPVAEIILSVAEPVYHAQEDSNDMERSLETVNFRFGATADQLQKVIDHLGERRDELCVLEARDSVPPLPPDVPVSSSIQAPLPDHILSRAEAARARLSAGDVLRLFRKYGPAALHILGELADLAETPDAAPAPGKAG